jgi:hypothetical protein
VPEHIPNSISRRFDDPEEVLRLTRIAVRKALADHKRLSAPVVIWRDGRAVWLPADEIPDFDTVTDPRALSTIKQRDTR